MIKILIQAFEGFPVNSKSTAISALALSVLVLALIHTFPLVFVDLSILTAILAPIGLLVWYLYRTIFRSVQFLVR